MDNNWAALATLVGVAIINFITYKITTRNTSKKDTENMRRSAYANLLTSAEEKYEASIGSPIDTERLAKANTQMNEALSVVDLVAPSHIALAAEYIEYHALKERGKNSREYYFNTLRNEMRVDLGIQSKIKYDGTPETWWIDEVTLI